MADCPHSRRRRARKVSVNPDATAADDWATLEGDGTLRRLTRTVGEINDAFAAHDDPRAATRPLTEPPETTFIDMHAALVSQPGIGKSLLGEAGYRNMTEWLNDGDSAVLITGRASTASRGRAMCAAGSSTGSC